MDHLSKRERSVLMAKVKAKNTDIEQILNQIVKPFWNKHRYRKNVKSLPGSPDIVFPKSKVVIFADGDFWHGRHYVKENLKWPPFWKKKIKKNVLRDIKQRVILRKLGYHVVRFWGSDLKRNPERCATKIKSFLTNA